jgi:hypothetical protein
MFNPTLVVIDAFINELRLMYERTYTTLEPSYPGIISLPPNLLLRPSRPVTRPTTTLITQSWSHW